jgi:hypothetical protein
MCVYLRRSAEAGYFLEADTSSAAPRGGFSVGDGDKLDNIRLIQTYFAAWTMWRLMQTAAPGTLLSVALSD